MTTRNKLSTAPPYAVEQTLQRLGANLRTARLRRNLTLAEIAEKIGTGVRAVADAERGKPSTGIAVYAGSDTMSSMTLRIRGNRGDPRLGPPKGALPRTAIESEKAADAGQCSGGGTHCRRSCAWGGEPE